MIRADLTEQLAASHPKLRRGRVWCTICGHSQAADSAHCLAHGWPKHCGVTMTIDSPIERGATPWPWRPMSEYEAAADADPMGSLAIVMVFAPANPAKGEPEYIGPARLWYRGGPPGEPEWFGAGRFQIPAPTLWAPLDAFRPGGADAR